MKHPILVGLGILVVVAGVALYRFFTDPWANGPTMTEVAQLFTHDAVKLPLTNFRIQNGDYPTTDEGLAALLRAPPRFKSTWKGPYLPDDRLPLDPWGRPYQYRYPGVHIVNGYDLWSLGPDGVSGTADDIGNW
jgi:general secretion pathway protein G